MNLPTMLEASTARSTRLGSWMLKHLDLVLFVAALVVALPLWQDFGLSWDELAQWDMGQMSYAYVFRGDEALLSFRNNDYGVAFELPLIMLEKILGLEDTRDVYLMRHLATHVFFLLGALACFRLVDRLYHDKVLATAGFLLMVVHPVLYPHSFFNSKDIPFLSLTMICMYLLVRAFQRGTTAAFALAGAGMGLLINIRIMGVLLPLFAAGMLVIDAWATRRFARSLRLAALLLVTTVGVLYATWPYLWTDPVEHFATAFANMSKFRWNGRVLFNGAAVKASELSWTYIPVWFTISTPIPYLLAGAVGTLAVVVAFVRSPRTFLLDPVRRYALMFLGYWIVPVVAVVVLGSVLYDSWRQVFFIYAPFVLLAVHGLWTVSRRSALARKLVAAFCAASFVATLAVMAAGHPLEHVYFNALVPDSRPEEVRERFEMDYWGTSYKQALEHILATDPAPVIRVAVANTPGLHNAMLLTRAQRERLRFVPVEEADYFVTNHRAHDNVDLGRHVAEPGRYSSFRIRISNSTISEVFKLE